MIAKTTSAPSFFPLAAYLAAGTDGRHAERVDWVTGRHIASDDLQVAPAIMEATAYQSARIERPCYHVVVSFDLSDHPSHAEMEHVGDRLLERLGLAEHQAVIVAHNDRPYAHIHMMVNRVHPETGIAWERWRDRPLIEAALRDAERALGMREVAGRLAPTLDQEQALPPAREPSLTWAERRQVERTGDVPLLDRARAALPDLRDASSWATLEATLAKHHLAIERTERGIVITDGRASVSASRVAPDLGLPRLEARFGERYPEVVPPPQIERVAELLRALVRDQALELAVLTATTEQHQRAAERTATDVAAQRACALSDQFTRDLGAVYADPSAARAAFDALEDKQGLTRAATVLREHPEQLGGLRVAESSRAFGLLGGRDVTSARAAATWVARSGIEAARARDEAGVMGAGTQTRETDVSAQSVAQARRELAAHRARYPNRDEIRREVGFSLERLTASEARALQRLVSSVELALARAIVQHVREIYTPKEHGRGQAIQSV